MSCPATTLSRADLLRALVLTQHDAAARAECLQLLGFVEKRAEARGFPAIICEAVGEVLPPPAVQAAVGGASILQVEHIAIVACEPLESVPSAAVGERMPHRPLTPERCQPQRTGRPPKLPLVRWPLLWPVLRRSLSVMRATGIDVSQLVARTARNLQSRQLPSLARRCWTGELLVVWDRGERMAPYERDYEEFLAKLLALRGPAGLTLFIVTNHPQQVRTAWRLGGAPGRVRCPELPAPSDTPLLLLSDLGALADDERIAERWRSFMRSRSCVAWVPHSAQLVDVRSARLARLYCLHPASRMRMQRGSSGAMARSHEHRKLLLERLLALCSCCVHLEPELLRALRLLDPATAAEPGIEALLWTHASVRHSRLSRPLSVSSQPHYRSQFQQLPAALKCAIFERIQQLHRWQGRSVGVQEALIWDSHADPSARSAMQTSIDAASQWLNDLTSTAGDGTLFADPREFAQEVLTRNWGDVGFQRKYSQQLVELLRISGSEEVPAGLSAEDVRRVKESRDELATYQLLQVGMQLQLWPEELVGSARTMSRLGMPLHCAGIELTAADRRRWIEPRGKVTKIFDLACPGTSVFLAADGHRYEIASMRRPSWAREMGRDRFGLYADLEVPAERGDLPQRFRWVEPGCFLMGSPGVDAFSNEGPCHVVTLATGFWLADTTCTRAQWDAVMGGNQGARFRREQTPVTRVSWDDAQAFLRALSKCTPHLWQGWRLDLPTEAQWEYACRAGARTTFNFGDEARPDRMNVFESGIGQPVTVKSLPANRWGLHEMHGNLWEWCADSPRHYSRANAIDPGDTDGPSGHAMRALRGGSWDGDGERARSASRGAGEPSFRSLDFGFRLCIRSSQTSPASHPRRARSIVPVMALRDEM